ncbi:MAG: type II 3-dehydroquinate dehydratase [bacterium]|nr:type II 3-dehydroquinate dehydratase [bacterium]
MKKILIIHGPNLNLLGEREPEIYGTQTLEDINSNLDRDAKKHDVELKFFQSNHEGAIIDEIQEQRKWMDGLIINPGAYTHTSIAIMDALSALECPIVEVHLSNIFSREKFRRHSYVSQVVEAVISGCSSFGYNLALYALLNE